MQQEPSTILLQVLSYNELVHYLSKLLSCKDALTACFRLDLPHKHIPHDEQLLIMNANIRKVIYPLPECLLHILQILIVVVAANIINLVIAFEYIVGAVVAPNSLSILHFSFPKNFIYELA